MNTPRQPGDPLLQRYHEANALDPARPDPTLRERVLARAREQATLNAPVPAAPPEREAANDRNWTLRALGSLAVLGLVGLLALQFDRSPPEERELAFGTAPVRAPLNAPEAASAAPAAAPAVAPAMAPPAATPDAPSTEKPARLPAPAPAAKAARPSPTEPARLRALPPPTAAPATPSPAPAATALPAPAADLTTDAPSAEATTGRTEAPASLSDAAPPPAAQAPAPAAAAEKSLPIPQASRRPAARMAAPMPPPEGLPAETDALGRTPLMRAAAQGDTPLVERLLAAGADRSQTDHQGWTAAEHARRAGHLALAQRLTPPLAPPADGQR